MVHITKTRNARILIAALVAVVLIAAIAFAVSRYRTHARADAAFLSLWHDKDPSVAQVSAKLQDGADVNAKGKDGETALMMAGRAGDFNLVEFLFSKGAHVMQIDSHGRTALTYAAKAGHGNCVFVLRGWNKSDTDRIDQTDDEGWSALSYAVASGDTLCVEILVSHANVNRKNRKGESELSLAHDHPDIIAILKAAGAR